MSFGSVMVESPPDILELVRDFSDPQSEFIESYFETSIEPYLRQIRLRSERIVNLIFFDRVFHHIIQRFNGCLQLKKMYVSILQSISQSPAETEEFKFGHFRRFARLTAQSLAQSLLAQADW